MHVEKKEKKKDHMMKFALVALFVAVARCDSSFDATEERELSDGSFYPHSERASKLLGQIATCKDDHSIVNATVRIRD